MKVVLIKYNAGNYASVTNALKRIGVEAEITDNHEKILAADKVIFPGVGEAQSTMRYLRKTGLSEVITGLIQPVLGICLGMQLLCSSSEEKQSAQAGDNSQTECLGVFPVKIKSFNSVIDPGELSLKIPHMGWNSITKVRESKLFDGIESGSSYFYFANGYFAEKSECSTAVCTHGIEFSVALEKDNFSGVQFHPEKSCTVGSKLLENFIK